MELKLELPLGRSFEEYIQMFDLKANDLSKRLIGCGDGFSTFNARMMELSYHVTSCDPLYCKSAEEIHEYLAVNRGPMIQQPRNRVEDSFWIYNNRGATMDEFLEDYEIGKLEGRYLPQSLPELPFDDRVFDIALCSHFLFTYSDMSLAFHTAAIREMLRIATEVRIFPLIDLQCRRPEFLEAVAEEFRDRGCRVNIVKVDYGFYQNGREMLQIINL